MSTLLKNINPDTTTTSIGGLEVVFFVPEESIKKYPAREGLILKGNLELHEGHTFFLLGYTRHTSSYEHQLRTSQRGALYDITQRGTIPTDTPELGSQFYYMAAPGRRYVLLFRDRNSFLRITPPGYALPFSYKFGTGDDPDNRYGYTVTFSDDTPYPCLYYSGSFEVSEVGTITPPVADSSAEPVRIRFNGNVIKIVNPGETLDITSDFALEDFEIKFI